MKVIVDGERLDLQEGDEVEIMKTDCGRCGCDHTELTVRRGKKTIVRVGDEVRLHGNDELYGGVVLDEEGNPKAEHRWVTHIIHNDKRGMTEDRHHYVGMCGLVLISDKHPTKLDKIAFLSEMRFGKDNDRICLKCKEVWNTFDEKMVL